MSVGISEMEATAYRGTEKEKKPNTLEHIFIKKQKEQRGFNSEMHSLIFSCMDINTISHKCQNVLLRGRNKYNFQFSEYQNRKTISNPNLHPTQHFSNGLIQKPCQSEAAVEQLILEQRKRGKKKRLLYCIRNGTRL